MSGFGARLHLIPEAPAVGPGTCEQPYPVTKQQMPHFYLLVTLLAGFSCLPSTSCAILQQNCLSVSLRCQNLKGASFLAVKKKKKKKKAYLSERRNLGTVVT